MSGDNVSTLKPRMAGALDTNELLQIKDLLAALTPAGKESPLPIRVSITEGTRQIEAYATRIGFQVAGGEMWLQISNTTPSGEGATPVDKYEVDFR